MAACPRLTELSVISPYPQTYCQETDTGVSLDSDGRAHSGMLKLTAACKTLQDFNTLQIVRPIVRHPDRPYDCDRMDGRCERSNHSYTSGERWEQILEKYVVRICNAYDSCEQGPGRGAIYQMGGYGQPFVGCTTGTAELACLRK